MPALKPLATTGLFCLLSGLAHAATPQDATQPPPAQHAVLTLEGRGVQIYTCRAAAGGGAPQWTFVAPAARLFDGDREVGTHGDGPVWQYQDGSSIHGQLLTKSASPDATAIPWLLLKGITPGRPGVLSTVEYIRRSNTAGGLAPTTGCDKDHILALAQIPYTATYTFYSSK